MAFDQATRNRLQKFVGDARKLLSDEFTQQLQNTYGLDPVTGGVAARSDLPALSPSEQQTAQLLRDTLEHYLAASHKADPHKDKALVTAALDRIVREQAFTVLNRLAALRMAEARWFVMESISQGYQSKGFQLYQRIAGSSLGETGRAYQHYLFSIFDELSLDLAVLFDRYSSQGRLFPRETVLLELLDLINHAELEILWVEDETVGWIYQYFNSKEERKKMRDESQAPRNSRELAVRNQFFTPRYVVEFLTDNTLGRIWYEMTKGNTALVDSCQYLVRRPNEIFLKSGEVSPEQNKLEPTELSQEELLQHPVFIQHRPIKDPRDIKMLDPACGSMHFGLYAFDLFEQIYSEAWDIEEEKGRDFFWCEEEHLPKEALMDRYPSKDEFLADVPRLVIEHNIHGVDIDPRAAQIAGLSLWLRAHRTWLSSGIKPNDRPQIQRSNIVCAEPMPGEKALLKEFTSQIQPKVLGQLVEEIFDKMKLAGEAGTLLKIEQEIQAAIEEAKSQKNESALEVQGGLFGDDKWEVREGKRYYNFGDVSEDFWGQAELLILSQLEKYAETATGVVSGQKRLFASDAAKGFSFIELCRKRFDVVLMNPPFGDFSKQWKSAAKNTYKVSGNDILAAFVDRGVQMQNSKGKLGAITARTCFYLKTFSEWREQIVLSKCMPEVVADLGHGVMDDAMVEVSAYVLGKRL
ncbi:BREX-1 system adenine-specific DNA-methyltransferase PglX [Pseudomonadales bacterium]|nr:BREX-1 system adenine-specific DNA-methyltransferase PglX [Pseudomonadales bacterium]